MTSPRDTWAAHRQFNPEAAAPPELQKRHKRRPKSKGKRAQLMAAAIDELLEYRKITDRLAAELVRQHQPNPKKSPNL